MPHRVGDVYFIKYFNLLTHKMKGFCLLFQVLNPENKQLLKALSYERIHTNLY